MFISRDRLAAEGAIQSVVLDEGGSKSLRDLRSQVLTRNDHIFTLLFPTTSKEASSSQKFGTNDRFDQNQEISRA